MGAVFSDLRVAVDNSPDISEDTKANIQKLFNIPTIKTASGLQSVLTNGYGVDNEGNKLPISQDQKLRIFPNTYLYEMPSGDRIFEIAVAGDRTYKVRFDEGTNEQALYDSSLTIQMMGLMAQMNLASAIWPRGWTLQDGGIIDLHFDDVITAKRVSSLMLGNMAGHDGRMIASNRQARMSHNFQAFPKKGDAAAGDNGPDRALVDYKELTIINQDGSINWMQFEKATLYLQGITAMRKAFELYATGEFSVDVLRHKLKIQTKRGKGTISKDAMCKALKNPFYIGIIRIKSSNETYKGIHQPLISRKLFNTVQDVLAGKVRRKKTIRLYKFSRLFKCQHCSYALTPEKQKGRIYYRCHLKGCKTKSVREDILESAIDEFFATVSLNQAAMEMLKFKIDELTKQFQKDAKSKSQTIEMRLQKINDQLDRLTDAFVDGLLEKDVFDERRINLLVSKDEIEAEKSGQPLDVVDLTTNSEKFFELLESLTGIGSVATEDEKCKLLKMVSSNRLAGPKFVDIQPRKPWNIIQKMNDERYCGGTRSRLRTETDELAKIIFKFLQDK